MIPPGSSSTHCPTNTHPHRNGGALMMTSSVRHSIWHRKTFGCWQLIFIKANSPSSRKKPTMYVDFQCMCVMFLNALCVMVGPVHAPSLCTLSHTHSVIFMMHMATTDDVQFGFPQCCGRAKTSSRCAQQGGVLNRVVCSTGWKCTPTQHPSHAHPHSIPHMHTHTASLSPPSHTPLSPQSQSTSRQLDHRVWVRLGFAWVVPWQLLQLSMQALLLLPFTVPQPQQFAPLKTSQCQCRGTLAGSRVDMGLWWLGL